MLDSKVRRTSADSGNNLNSSPECHLLHSNQEAEKVSLGVKRNETARPLTSVTATATSQGTEDNDDRPGTPLCDENPEGFEAPRTSPSVKSDTPPATVTSKSSESTPGVPSKAQPVKSSKSSTVSVKDSKFSTSGSGGSGNNSAKKVVSPTISPSSGASSSVMLSSTNDTSIFSPNNSNNNNNSTESSSETPAYSKSSTNSNVFETATSKLCGVAEEVVEKRDRTDNSGNSSVVSVSDQSGLQGKASSVTKAKSKEAGGEDEFASGAGFSSDSEGGLSPRNSPTGDSLEQRVKNLCERYDTWDGNRKILKHTPTVSHSPITSNNPDSGIGGSSKDSLIDQIKQTIPQFSGTSDIGRTVLARKSIFDEDCERLVNFNEKYETKPTALINSSTNWKLPTLSRSCSSTSSVPYLGQTSPLANCVPTPLSVISGISPTAAGPLSAGSVSKPPLTPLSASSPNYSSPSLSSAIVGKSVSEKVKDLNANVTPQLTRSSSTSSASSSISLAVPAKSYISTTPTTSKPAVPTHVGISSSISLSHVSTKSTSSPQLSCPPVKIPNGPAPGNALVVGIPGKVTDLGGSVGGKKPSNITLGQSVAGYSGTPTSPAFASSPIPPTLLQNNGPRAVERSLSTESRKSSPGVSTSGFQVTFPNSSGSSSHSSESSGSFDSTRPSTPRRISVDTPSSASSSISVDSQVSTKQALYLSSGNHEKSSDTSEKSDVSREKVSSVSEIHALQLQHTFKDKIHHPKDNQLQSSGCAPSINPSGSTNSGCSIKTVPPTTPTIISKKNPLSSLKDEISSKVQPVHQETTVAVVATIQTPLLTARNELINTPKESSKKDKDKKRRSSGSSAPLASGAGGGGGGNNGHQSGPSSLKSETHSNQGSSTSSSRSSGNKDRDERKERKESKSSSNAGESGSKSEETQSHHSGSHHKKEKRDKEKDHRDNSADRSAFSSISKESHSHKRDKDNKDSKTKRRLSSQENNEQGKKKANDFSSNFYAKFYFVLCAAFFTLFNVCDFRTKES